MSNHRYTLFRKWGFRIDRKILNFIMLNPSTADDKFDDPTIRRCVGFAKRWGFDGIVVTNLYAFSATDPKELKDLALRNAELAVGEDADLYIMQEASNAAAVCAAWGDNCDYIVPRRDLHVVQMIRGRDILCIRKTAKGNPAHPVREQYTEQPLVLYSALNTIPETIGGVSFDEVEG